MKNIKVKTRKKGFGSRDTIAGPDLGYFRTPIQIGDYYWSSVKGGKWIYLSFLLGLLDDILAANFQPWSQ